MLVGVVFSIGVSEHFYIANWRINEREFLSTKQCIDDIEDVHIYADYFLTCEHMQFVSRYNDSDSEENKAIVNDLVSLFRAKYHRQAF